MTEPSEYELAEWRKIQQFRGRPLSRAMRGAGQQLANGAAALGKGATKRLEKHPRARAAVSRGQQTLAKGARKVGSGARGAADALPDWSGSAVHSIRRTAGRVARVGLSPERVVALHAKRGHDVAALADLCRLDLAQIDAVRGRGASWYYPAAAALSGAGAGLVISGGELVIVASAGAASAPSGGAIVGAYAADAAVVLGLASRSVGQVSLAYGYDPEEPAEKLFVMSVVNAGTATTTSAKTAAFADVSRLTQALFRGKTWEVLSDSVITKVSQRFAAAFGFRLTKNGLGKAVPAVGIVVGGAFNWTTLETIVDAADVAYRRRFLLDKYPHLADDEAPGSPFGQGSEGDLADMADSGEPGDSDVAISLLGELAEAGGPDLR